MGGPSGGGGFNPNQQPTRPMPMGSPSTGEIPVRLTPITGRVSRAKKGIAVHTCELCNPPKVRNPPNMKCRGDVLTRVGPDVYTSRASEVRRLNAFAMSTGAKCSHIGATN